MGIKNKSHEIKMKTYRMNIKRQLNHQQLRMVSEWHSNDNRMVVKRQSFEKDDKWQTIAYHNILVWCSSDERMAIELRFKKTSEWQ